MYKYKTKNTAAGEFTVLRTRMPGWPREDDCEALVLEAATRAEALREAKLTPAHCWG